MDYTRNEDKLGSSGCNYNLIYQVNDISEESGPVQYPVTLEEIKKYLRLEGYVENQSEGLVLQPALTMIFESGETFLINPLLAQTGVSLVVVTKEGHVFTVITSGIPNSSQVLFDASNGKLTFLNASNGETVNVIYGIQEVSSSIADEFDFDDDLLNNLIAEGARWVEEYTGLHLTNKSLQVLFVCGVGMLELPGPVRGSIVFKTTTGQALPAPLLLGNPFPMIDSVFADKTFAEYSAGYDPITCPEGLKLAIMAYIADNYEHRGDEVELPADTKRAAMKAKTYRRTEGLWA